MIDLNQKKEKDDGITIIQSAEIQTQKFLCKGGFGAIYKGKYQNIEVAQKKISKSNNPQTAPEVMQQVVDQKMAQDQKQQEQKDKRVARAGEESEWVRDIEREARMTHLCRGPNVVPLIGVNKVVVFFRFLDVMCECLGQRTVYRDGVYAKWNVGRRVSKGPSRRSYLHFSSRQPAELRYQQTTSATIDPKSSDSLARGVCDCQFPLAAEAHRPLRHRSKKRAA